jgi:DNA-binding MarR family transcriptional regulator
MEKNELKVFSLNLIEYKIYNFFLVRLLEHKTNSFTEGQKSLAKAIDAHENSICNAVKSLMKKGWLKRIRSGKQYSLYFTPPEAELQCRISYCTGVNYESFTDLKIKGELKDILEKLRSDIEELEQEVPLLEQKQQIQESKKITLTREHIIDFVERLLVRIGNSLDPRSLENKVLTEINLLKNRLSSNNTSKDETQTESSVSLSDYDFTSSTVHDGYEEILRPKGKK